jgi:hypothetical protein
MNRSVPPEFGSERHFLLAMRPATKATRGRGDPASKQLRTISRTWRQPRQLRVADAGPARRRPYRFQPPGIPRGWRCVPPRQTGRWPPIEPRFRARSCCRCVKTLSIKRPLSQPCPNSCGAHLHTMRCSVSRSMRFGVRRNAFDHRRPSRIHLCAYPPC